MSLPWNFSSVSTPIVHHYTSAEAAHAMVENRSIWLSEHSAMNDSSEFAYARDRLLALMRDREVDMDTLARYCMVSAVEALIEGTGLMLGSLTARRDDLGQWRSYASNGAGCVLGIDAAYLEHDAGVAIRTVLYDETQVDRMLRIALGVVQQQYADAPDDVAMLMDFARHAAIDLFNIKHPGFADEREVRIARMLVRAEDGSLSDVGGNRTDGSEVPSMPVAKRTGAFGETNYVALPLSRRDGSNAIVSVGLGPTMSDTDRVQHRAFFEAHGLTVWQSTLPYRV
jgi:hypothetical protein